MTDHPEALTIGSPLAIARPQTHYKRPWPHVEAVWTLFIFLVLPIILAISIFVPGGRIPTIVAYVSFIVVGGIGLIIFTLTDPAFGIPRTVQLPRMLDDNDGSSAYVRVLAVRPLFGRRKCGQVGGRHFNKLCEGNVINYNHGYARYKRLFGTKADRCRWEPAIFVMGSGKTQDCTDIVRTPTAGEMTRLEWMSRRDASIAEIRTSNPSLP